MKGSTEHRLSMLEEEGLQHARAIDGLLAEINSELAKPSKDERLRLQALGMAIELHTVAQNGRANVTTPSDADVLKTAEAFHGFLDGAPWQIACTVQSGTVVLDPDAKVDVEEEQHGNRYGTRGQPQI